ncbi:glycoside hydrolase family 127 protein [Paenibacillus xanthanilyticus]|uniref:Glycoside hydrolase family 127 protein n=1 Tax=Paenibacillus xanthanilyticus TaxID=1783531 RepID=A0ABV8K1L5_9BACL
MEKNQIHRVVNWTPVPFNKVNIQDDFWLPRLTTLKQATLPACLAQCEKTGRISNFARAGGLEPGPHQGMYYDDSDVYKVLEGAAYTLMLERDPVLEKEVDRIIGLIAAAQETDGYLSTSYTLTSPELKWTDMEKHEMYNGGHLIEAAVAYYEATGKRELLGVACKLADHYLSTFGPGKRHWVEGHQEIELALVKLYHITGEAKYLSFAHWLLEERGHGHGSGAIWEKEDWGPAYCQDDVPVKDIEKVTGHAVRAMYLYAGMADVARAAGEEAYLDALLRVWAHTVERNMYVTGGIGPSQHNEGFTVDYDLPNHTAYCETCASIGMALWNHRMNLLFGDAKYADIVELELYNGALAGLSLTGDKFFYVNPLASEGNHHRVEWFHTSCCPTNLARFLPSVGGYQYAAADQGIVCNQYIAGHAELQLSDGFAVRIESATEYPWEGNIRLKLRPERARTFPLLLRIPGWCRGFQVFLNRDRIPPDAYRLEKGYLVLERNWNEGDTVELRLDEPVQLVRARAEVEANRGRFAIRRGPLLYCLEQADNPLLRVDDYAIPADITFTFVSGSDILEGTTMLLAHDRQGNTFRWIPYYAWDNRSPGFMQVWVKEFDTRALYQE